MSESFLNKSVVVKFGDVSASIFGGPYRNFQSCRRLVGVKMAAEISHPHHISIPTEDFSVPDVVDMEQGMLEAVKAILQGNDVYVGCMGGIGRTGLFMGCMAKAMNDYAEQSGRPDNMVGDPVAFVRRYYKAHAIETAEQQVFVRTFDTTSIVEYLQLRLAPKVEYVERIMTPLDWFLSLFQRN